MMVESRTIRVPKNKVVFLLRGKLISRDMIKPHTDKLELPNIVLRLAKRIFSFTDIDVKVGDEWVHVPCCNSEMLEKLYEPIVKPAVVESIAVTDLHNSLLENNDLSDISIETNKDMQPKSDIESVQENMVSDPVEKIEKPKFKKRH